MTRVITFGSFDFFHYGHYRILKRSSQYGEQLIVGLSSDELHERKKNRRTINSWDERAEVLRDLNFVSTVFKEESLEEKRRYIIEQKADILIMGDDWAGKFDFLSDICEVIYLPRTDGVSTTDILKMNGWLMP